MTQEALTEARRELARRELARRNLLEFIHKFWKNMVFGDFHHTLASALQQFIKDVEDKKSPRLIIEAPPRVGKSLLVTRGFTPFILGHHPDWEVICASATLRLADQFGREINRILNDPYYHKLFPLTVPDPDSNAISLTRTTERGGYMTVGVGGTLTGFGGSVIIIDDPLSDEAEINSETIMDTKWDWLNSVALTRLAPGGGAIVMHTRWGVDDIVGRILASDTKGRWKRITFPALTEDGKSIHEERWPASALLETRDALIANGKARTWAALYQQQPFVESGDFFKEEWFNFKPAAHIPKEHMSWCIGGDFAVSTNNTADYTALVPIGTHASGTTYISPLAIRKRMTLLESVDALIDLATKHKPLQFFASERGVLNAAVMPLLTKRMRERGVYFTIKEVTRATGKHVLAAPYQARLQAGVVVLPDTPFFRTTFLQEHLAFKPDSKKHDDMIDAISNAVHFLPSTFVPIVPRNKPVDPVGDEEEQWNRILKNAKSHKYDPTQRRKFNGSKY